MSEEEKKKYFLTLLDEERASGKQMMRCQCTRWCTVLLWIKSPVIVSGGKTFSFACGVSKKIISQENLVAESLEKDRETRERLRLGPKPEPEPKPEPKPKVKLDLKVSDSVGKLVGGKKGLGKLQNRPRLALF